MIIMTLNEAVDICKKAYFKSPELKKAVMLCAKAAEKQLAAPVDRVAYFYGTVFYCPDCKLSIDTLRELSLPQNCKHCGKKLLWD